MLRHTSETSRRPHASRTAPLGTCSINCCLHRACRLRTPSIARIKETTCWTLWNFYSMCSLVFPFSLFLPIPIPHLGPPLLSPAFFFSLFFFSSATKQTRKTSLSLCHIFQLDFLPAQKHSSISLVLSQLTSLLSLPGAKTWLGREGGDKEKNGAGGDYIKKFGGWDSP